MLFLLSSWINTFFFVTETVFIDQLKMFNFILEALCSRLITTEELNFKPEIKPIFETSFNHFTLKNDLF
jgi:hypothetical protein